MSDRSNPLHWIFSPFSWPPTSSRQWTIFSTWEHIHVIDVFKMYINAMLELCNDIYHDILKREEGEARPMTKYSRVEAPGCKLIFLTWAILAIRMYHEGVTIFSYFLYNSILYQSPGIIAAKKHRLEMWTAVSNCGQLLVTWTPVEYFRKFRHCRPYW